MKIENPLLVTILSKEALGVFPNHSNRKYFSNDDVYNKQTRLKHEEKLLEFHRKNLGNVSNEEENLSHQYSTGPLEEIKNKKLKDPKSNKPINREKISDAPNISPKPNHLSNYQEYARIKDSIESKRSLSKGNDNISSKERSHSSPSSRRPQSQRAKRLYIAEDPKKLKIKEKLFASHLKGVESKIKSQVQIHKEMHRRDPAGAILKKQVKVLFKGSPKNERKYELSEDMARSKKVIFDQVKKFFFYFN